MSGLPHLDLDAGSAAMPFESMMTTAFRKAQSALEQTLVVSDVVEWAATRLGVEMWSKQAEVARAVQEYNRTAVWSCHDTGKTFGAAVITCHHIDRYPVGQARAITTAPSNTQVRGALWVEINALHERARDRGTPLPGRVNQTEWWIGSYMAGIGRKPNDYSSDQFAGFHARYPLVIMDEGDGMSADMWEGIEALLTNRKSKLFVIGNPLDSGSRFAQVRKRWEKGDPTYHGIVIGYKDTPNFSGEEVSEYLADSLLGTEWVEEKRVGWGDPDKALADPAYEPVDNPFWWGRILGQYPPEDSSSIITMSYVQKCLDPDAPVPELGMRQLGVDVAASEGGDWTVARERVGNTPLRQWKIRTSDDDAIEDFIVSCAVQARARAVVFDAGGVGFGFTGRLRKRLRGVSVSPVNFGATATVKQEDGKTKKYANIRAQLYYETGREQLRQGLLNLSHMEDYEETIADLTAPRLDAERLAKDGVILVEEKSEVKKRLGRSPDNGDAFLLAFHQPKGGGVVRTQRARGQMPTGAAAAVGRHGQR